MRSCMSSSKFIYELIFFLNMESENKRILEKIIDIALKEDVFSMKYKYWKSLHDDGIIDSIKSAMIGDVKGTIFVSFSILKGNESYTQAEGVDLVRIMRGCAREIKSKVTKMSER